MRRSSLVSAALFVATFAFAYAQVPQHGSGTIFSDAVVEQGTENGDGTWTVGIQRFTSFTNHDFHSRTVILKTDSDPVTDKSGGIVLPAEISSRLRSHGSFTVRQPFPQPTTPLLLSGETRHLNRIAEIRFDKDVPVVDICHELETATSVEYAEPKFIYRTIGEPNDPLFGDQYALQLVRAVDAWNSIQGDSSVTIAIVDHGVDTQHEDLAARIWINVNEIPDNGIDDDLNGHVDDVNGWDFVGNASIIQATAGLFQGDNDPNPPASLGPRDSRQHGVHCAGVAAAVADNDKGIAGLGSGCRIMPVKIGSDQIGRNVYQSTEAVYYAGINGADVISCSWGGGPASQMIEDVFQEVTEMGSLIVAASGNDGKNVDDFPHFPSSYPMVFAVGASDSADRPAGFSNYGITTDVFAPGVNILSTVSGPEKYNGSWSGTSMATPLVSGLAGLIKSLHPDWTPEQIKQQIRSTVDNTIQVPPIIRPQYFGRINAERAVTTNADLENEAEIPGIVVTQSSIDVAGGIITGDTPIELTLEFANRLGRADDVRIVVQSMFPELQLADTIDFVDSLLTGSSTTATFSGTFAVGERWFAGDAHIRVAIESEDYVNYDLVEIPFEVPSSTSFALLVDGLPAETEALGGSSPAPDVLWGVGHVPGLGGGYVRFVSGDYDYGFVSPEPLTSIYAVDATEAFIASASAVYHTSTSGSSWAPTTVDHITADLANVYFFDSDNGVVVGDPVNGDLGIGVSTDGGGSWEPIDMPIAAEADETVVGDAVAWVGNKGWFGTSTGRIVRTSDAGATWTTGTIPGAIDVQFLSFSSTTHGIAFYVPEGQPAFALSVAATSDGGETWNTDAGKLIDLGIREPVHLGSPGYDGVYVILSYDGSVMMTEDNGQSWEFQKSRKTNAAITSGTVSSNDTHIRVWSLGTAVGYLDIPFSTSGVEENEADIPDEMDLSVVEHPNQ